MATIHNSCEFNLGNDTVTGDPVYIDAAPLSVGSFINPQPSMPDPTTSLRNSSKLLMWLYIKGAGPFSPPKSRNTGLVEMLGNMLRSGIPDTYELELVEAGDDPGKGSIVMSTTTLEPFLQSIMPFGSRKGPFLMGMTEANDMNCTFPQITFFIFEWKVPADLDPKKSWELLMKTNASIERYDYGTSDRDIEKIDLPHNGVFRSSCFWLDPPPSGAKCGGEGISLDKEGSDSTSGHSMATAILVLFVLLAVAILCALLWAFKTRIRSRSGRYSRLDQDEVNDKK